MFFGVARAIIQSVIDYFLRCKVNKRLSRKNIKAKQNRGKIVRQRKINLSAEKKSLNLVFVSSKKGQARHGMRQLDNGMDKIRQ